MEPTDRRLHVIRVMNALTPEHMAEERVRKRIRACEVSLFEGALLVLGCSPEDAEDNTRVRVYEWNGHTLQSVWRMHGAYGWPQLAILAE